MTNRLCTALLAVLLALFAVAGSLAVPILCRPFYYLHIELLDLPEQTPWDAATIRAAYDEVMDYLLLDAPFGTGALSWSESGRSHFEDVRLLFRLDLAVTAVTGAALLVLWLLWRRLPRPAGGRGAPFWAGCGILAGTAALGAACAIDFDAAFAAFHQVFFPGKTNWLFDPRTDEIIRILPEAYFRDCAALALALLLAFAAVYLLAGRKGRKM